ncbi:MAG: metallophosphoesterase [Planctomycetes bacterium]|nr:metallophosphoesterase [Planctomycetota bacterium]
MMKSLKLIQLGDVHFPEAKSAQIGDLKDEAAPKSLVTAIAPKRLELVMRKVSDVAADPTVCGLLICGDLTTYGDLDEYRRCVEYLNKIVEVGSPDRWPDNSLHVVPGNHDVARELCDPDGVDLFEKFAPLVASWDKLGRNAILPVQGIRSTVLKPNGHSLSLFSLNSCIGCGERRHLPAKIQDELATLLKKYLTSAPPADAFDLIGEQLDTPAFVDDHVRSLVTEINNLADTSVPIVLAHHNVLPQAIPRVEIYTELINGGLFRTQLASCCRPIIYCHGHIHDDPIEQLTDHRYPASKILFVSAPMLVDGFNVIEIVFARNNLPLGCKIHRYRSTPHGSIDNSGVVIVPLAGAEVLSRFDDERLRALLKVCGPEFIRFEELRTGLQNELGTLPNFATVGDVVFEAEWLSLVEVKDGTLPHKHWQVRRIEP